MKKTASEIKHLLNRRQSWADNRRQCWVCGATHHAGFPLETHEMERKSQAPHHAWAKEENYFRACKKCHMDDLAAMPHAKQLAYKYIHDILHYNLESWLRIKDPELRAPSRVTEDEVMEYVYKLVMEGNCGHNNTVSAQR